MVVVFLHVMVVVFYMSYDTVSFVCGMRKSFHMSWCFFFSCHVVLAFLVFYFRVFGSTCELLQSIYTYEGLRDEFFLVSDRKAHAAATHAGGRGPCSQG